MARQNTREFFKQQKKKTVLKSDEKIIISIFPNLLIHFHFINILNALWSWSHFVALKTRQHYKREIGTKGRTKKRFSREFLKFKFKIYKRD